ncbi:MAG: AAA family ATPase, partial [Rhodothermales bacterium]|nr:AAA family ATPase [Rhodothermales bacterium]
MRQESALEILKTGVNVFLTGAPGSGKTHTIDRYIRWLQDHRVGVGITASTGIAATHIGGLTIHSWSGVGIRDRLSNRDLKTLTGNDALAE